jgi:UDP-N-acetylmuramate--alanine ligase
MFNQYKSIHFIGIGGSGISALATLAQSKGCQVSGSDLSENPTTQHLKKDGILIHIGHQASNLDEKTDLVVYSGAIDKEKNPEYQEALERKTSTLSYFEALGRISKSKKTIAVTGTHGKTTTTAMLGQALIAAGLDPTVIVGSQVPAFDNRNIHIGKSDWLVVEACEYKRSFLNLHPFGMILLNCEVEHLDYFKDEEDYVLAFKELVSKLPKDGFLVFNNEDSNAKSIANSYQGKSLTAITAEAKIDLQIPGRFNQLNAQHVLLTCRQIEADESEVAEALKAFRGTSRRMEIKGEMNGALVIDDYGHHPTEIKATLGALKEEYPERRLLCVFQPHQYSRSHKLITKFQNAFADADQVIIPDIFEARDSQEDKKRISALSFAESINQIHKSAIWGKSKKETVGLLQKIIEPNDIVVTMGAGDVYRIGEELLSHRKFDK